MNRIGEKLHIARKIRGLTMREAGSQLGFSRKTISRWEHGTDAPHPVHARIIEEASDTWLREAANL